MNLMLTTEAILLLPIAAWLLCLMLEENLCQSYQYQFNTEAENLQSK